MSYQFELDQSNRSLRFPVILMAGIVCTVIAAYSFAACGDRTPDQARASEPPAGGSPTSSVPVGNASTEKPALVISGPATFEMADSAYRDRRYGDATTLFKTYAAVTVGGVRHLESHRAADDERRLFCAGVADRHATRRRATGGGLTGARLVGGTVAAGGKGIGCDHRAHDAGHQDDRESQRTVGLIQLELV